MKQKATAECDTQCDNGCTFVHTLCYYRALLLLSYKKKQIFIYYSFFFKFPLMCQNVPVSEFSNDKYYCPRAKKD